MICRSDAPSTSSMTMAAPDGDSTYSYSRTTFGSSTEARTSASLRNIVENPGSSSRSAFRYLIATSVPEASCLARTTFPNPPVPSSRRAVYPGTVHSAMSTGGIVASAMSIGLLAAVSPAEILSAADLNDGRGALSVGPENLQGHLLRSRAVPLALDGDGHEDVVRPGHHGLAERLRRRLLRGEDPLVGDRPGRAVGGDLPGHVHRAAVLGRLQGGHASHLERRVVEPQEQQDPGRREQDHRQDEAGQPAVPDRALGRVGHVPGPPHLLRRHL